MTKRHANFSNTQSSSRPRLSLPRDNRTLEESARWAVQYTNLHSTQSQDSMPIWADTEQESQDSMPIWADAEQSPRVIVKPKARQVIVKPKVRPRKQSPIITVINDQVRAKNALVCEKDLLVARHGAALSLSSASNGLSGLVESLAHSIAKKSMEIERHIDSMPIKCTKFLVDSRMLGPSLGYLSPEDITTIESFTSLYGLVDLVSQNCGSGASCTCYQHLDCGYWKCDTIRFCNGDGCSRELPCYRSMSHLCTHLTRSSNHNSVDWNTGVMSTVLGPDGNPVFKYPLHQTLSRRTSFPTDIDTRLAGTAGLIFGQMPEHERSNSHVYGISCDDAYSATTGAFCTTGHTTFSMNR